METYFLFFNGHLNWSLNAYHCMCIFTYCIYRRNCKTAFCGYGTYHGLFPVGQSGSGSNCSAFPAATVLGKIKEEKESGFFVKLGNRDEKILDTLLNRKIPVLLFVFLLFGASIYLALSMPLKEYDVFVTKETNESMGMEELKNLEIESTDKEGKKNRILLSELADFITREGHDFSYLSCS